MDDVSVSDFRKAILENVMQFAEAFPDMVALWSGMVRQLMDDGWPEQAARALVLSSVTADNAALLSVFPDAYGGEEEGDEQEA